MFNTYQEELDFLEKLGFSNSQEYTKFRTPIEIWEYMQQVAQTKSSIKYPIDGLVIKLNDNKLTQDLGVVGKTKRGWCALKFEATEITTQVLEVTWQVGRTGKVTPVVELEPVTLQGTIVKRTSHRAVSTSSA